MANTTNFGWETPDDTDLVKDGAAAMRTLGNSIDASFVDLKGGTTGQILSKNSNTDLDFTWAAPTAGDITGVTAGSGLSGGGTSGDVTISLSAPVSATNGGTAQTTYTTGDILYASASNTLTKRAIGTTGQVLTVSGGVPTWATASSGALTKITTATLSTSSSTWDIDNIFSSTYTNYVAVAVIKGTQTLRGRWLESGTALTGTDYRGLYYTINTSISLSGTDTDNTNFYLCNESGSYSSASVGTMTITRVGISSPDVGVIKYDFQNQTACQRWTGGKLFQDGFNNNHTITGIRLYTSSGNINSGSTFSVYGLEN